MRAIRYAAGAAALSLCAIATAGVNVIINEVDADTPGTDILEFIELYDGGVGNTSLDGLIIVLFNGSDDLSYLPVADLNGFSTDANGYFVIGSTGMPEADIDLGTGWLQNGADAVALIAGAIADYPNDTPIPVSGIVDAIVYDTNEADDAGLLVLLNAGQPQVNEGSSNSATESSQRCPNGSGGARNTDTYAQQAPTPGAANFCPLPLGACCDTETGACTDTVSEVDCTASGGVYGGDGSECATLDPPCVALGACCDDITGVCNDGVSQADCDAMGLRYGGDASVCATIDPPCVAAVLPGNLLLTEIVDGTLPFGNPKWAEITNCDVEAIDLSLYSIGNFNNGGTTLGGGAATVLSGMLAPGDSFVFAYEAPDNTACDPILTCFEFTYGFTPDLYAGGGFINGDDVVALFFGAAEGDGSNATLVDVYGEIGVDGTGQAWEYTDGYSRRNPGHNATATFTADQWTIAGVNALETGVDKEELELLQTLTTPETHDCTGTVLISEIVDATLTGGQPKWVEISNCGDTAIDLANYSVGNFNNGGTTLGGGAASSLAGTLSPGASYVVAYEDFDNTGCDATLTCFELVYGFAPDQYLGPFINGDDVVALFFGAATGDGTDATLVDIYGVIGVDGSGTEWEHTDSYARRQRSNGPDPSFEADQWFIPGPNALETGDDDEELALILDVTFPGTHSCATTCLGDFDGSGDVGFGDLLFMLSEWGGDGGSPADISDNGAVGFTDLLLLLSIWGPC